MYHANQAHMLGKRDLLKRKKRPTIEGTFENVCHANQAHMLSKCPRRRRFCDIFSKVSALVCSCKSTKGGTFENVFLRHRGDVQEIVGKTAVV